MRTDSSHPDRDSVSTGRKHTPLTLFRNAEFLALAAVNFASGMAFATIIIALALYAEQYAVSGIVAGLFGTAYAVIRLFLVLPMGRWVDVGNPKRHLLAGMILTIVVLVGFTFVDAASHVIALRSLQGAASITLLLAGTGLVGQIAPEEERGLWLGTYKQARSFSSLSGDLAGGAMLFLFGFGVTYTALAVVVTLATAMAYVFVRDEPNPGAEPDANTGIENLRLLMNRSAIKALVFFRFSFSFGKMAVIIFLPIYARTEFGLSAFAIGGILAGGKLTKSVAQGYIGDLSDRIGGREWFVFAGTVLYALGTGMIPFAGGAAAYLPAATVPVPGWVPGAGAAVEFAPAFFWLFIAYVILGIADSLRIPTSVAMFVEEGEHYDAVAGSLSLRSVSWQVGAIVGPLAVGGMLDYTTFFEAFGLAAAFMIVAGIVFIYLYSAEADPDVVAVRADD